MRKTFSRKISIVQQVIILMLVSVMLLHAAPSDFQQNKVDQTRQSSARIDPVTLGLNIEIPLGSYPGRGGTSVPLSISYSSKLWSTGTTLGFNSPGGCNNPRNGCGGVNIPELTQAIFANNSIAGWTSSLKVPKIVFSGKSQYFDSTYGTPSCTECAYTNHIQRIHVYLPDGSTHELRKSDTPVAGNYNTVDWTGTYYAVDGSNMRYETESKTLFLPDGSRYIIYGALTGNDNTAYYDTMSQRIYDNYRLTQPAEYIDRNGNKLSYNPTTKEWKDTLGRDFGNPLPPEPTSTPSFSHIPNNPTQTANFDSTYTMPGFGTGTMQYTFRWKKLQDAFSSTSYQLQYPGNLHRTATPDTNPLSPALFQNTVSLPEQYFNPFVLAEVVLPDGQTYKFGYNPYGEIDKLTHPTGAYEKFTYSYIVPIDQQLAYAGNGNELYMNRGVTEHRVSAKGDGTDEITTQYAAGYASTTYPFTLPYKSTVTNPDGTVTERFVHANYDPYGTNAPKYGFDNPFAGKVYDEQLKRGTTVLRRTLTEWTASGPLTGGYSTATRNPRVTRQTEILFEGTDALAKSTTYDHDVYQNVKSTVEYDFVPVNYSTAQSSATLITSISLGTKKRTTEVDYKNDATSDAAYISRQMISLPKEKRVLNASDQVVAKSEISYDDTAYSVLSYTGTPTQWQDPGTSPRGNATTTKSYSDIANNQYVTSHARYDQFGNLRYAWDGLNNLSQTEYSPTFNYAYPTRTLSPKPDPSGITGSANELETITDYDFKTGLVKSVTDANGQTAYNSYADPVTQVIDPLLRLRKVTAPNNHQTITEYGVPNSSGQLDASQRFVRVKTQIDEVSWKQGYTWSDGLGRTIKTQTVDSSGDVFVLSCYDNIGRLEKVSNPFRNVSNAICGSSLEWTTNTYDDLGRITKVKTPDNAEVNTAYSLAASTSAGATVGTAVTVTDQALKQRRSITNGLGQLLRVDEPTDANGLGSINSPNQPTYYTYDTLNNLTTVQQDGTGAIQCGGTLVTCSQTRTFVYDALSRLKSATNPEMGTTPTNGTINYQYDNNGNLQYKTDPRGVLTTYGYDALNRVVSRSYTNEPSGQLTTPSVSYNYDNLQNAKGKLTKVTTIGTGLNTFSSVTEYQVFDQMGRVTQSQQTTDGATYGVPMTYIYNLSGALIEQKYPSGRVVKNVLDNDGDLEIVRSKKTGSAGYWNYADSFTYTAAGAVSSMQLGNGRWESTVFNSRLQPTQIALGTVQNGTDKLKLEFGYGTTQNNGNVISQIITVPTETRGGNNYAGFVATQNYTYDALNRLQSAEETIPSQTGWKQTFKYDRYGNRNFDYGTNPSAPLTNTPNAQNTLPKVANPEALASNNRFKSDQDNDNVDDYLYDASGNLTRDAEYKKFTYDAENKQTKAETVNSGGTTISTLGEYFYDGDGKRVKKFVPSIGETTVFVYDASGRLVAEYSTIVAPIAQAEVSYLTSDHLGSPRINTDQNGNVTARHDYQPFGEEIPVVPGQTARTGYSGDNVRKQFTSYERDIETDLDCAQARMYQNKFGRFNSPDPLMASAIVKSPKTWNRYVYALNNPLKYTDPDGLATKPVFKEFDRLTEDEQRILNNSTVKIGKGKNAKQLSGKDLYDALASDGNKKGNKQLANFLNQTATLSSQTFSNGRTAISYVKSVSNIQQDRITANVDSDLKSEIEKISDSRIKDDPTYKGPENSSAFHGIYDVSFRENQESGPQQISFASSKEFKEADIDIDYSQKGSIGHVGEVVQNTLFRTKTDPYKVYSKLQDRKIQPSYNIPTKK